jgi:hypothetical protein
VDKKSFGKGQSYMSMDIWNALANAHSAVPDFQLGLSVTYEKLGNVHQARQDWDADSARGTSATQSGTWG